MTSPLKVAVVGAGIGRVHIEGYRKTGRADVVAVCDVNAERAAEVAARMEVPRHYVSVDDMLQSESLDAISVAVPNAYHAPIVEAAAQAGVAVICEKPMADTLANAERIHRAVTQSGIPFMMGYNNRYRAESRHIRGMVEDGALGDIYYAKCGWVRRHGIPGMGGWFTTKKLSGGGPMMDLGVHAMDLTLWLMGFPKVVAVSGASYAKFGPEGRGAAEWKAAESAQGSFDVEDLAVAFLRLENGGTVTVEASWAQFVPEDRLYATLYGTRGGADVEPFRIYRDNDKGEIADYTPVVEPIAGHHAEVSHFVDSLLDGSAPDGTVDEGLALIRVIDAIYRSAQTGTEILL